MSKATAEEQRAFELLRNTAVHAYLLRSYDAAKELLVSHGDADVIKRVQGAAQSLRSLLDLIDRESISTSGKRG